MEPPSTAQRTLSEVNCRLCHLDGSNERSSVPACPDIFLRPSEAPGHDAAEAAFVRYGPPGYGAEEGGSSSGGVMPRLSFGNIATQALSHIKSLASTTTSSAKSTAATPAAAPALPLAWHPQRPLLAAADASDTVYLFDFTGRVPLLGQPSPAVPPPLPPSQALRHPLQAGAGAGAVAWRPTRGLVLAVGCSGGVCLWHLSGPPSATKTPSLTWLQSPTTTNSGGITMQALAWHPQGHLLAAASLSSPGFVVWDAATGAAVRVRAGLEPCTVLGWSPCGAYLLAGGGPSGAFRVWETAKWQSARWTVGGGASSSALKAAGALVGAEWSPDSRTLLVAHARQLSTLHWTADAPALTAQVLPVPLAELGPSKGASGSCGGAGVVEGVAWDPRGQRLAVLLAASRGHPAAGCVAVYDTRCDPIMTARLVGYARVEARGGRGAAPPAAAAAEEWEIVEAPEEEIQEESASTRAAGENVSSGKGAALAFMKFEQGSVLAVRKGDFVGCVPMYFSL